MFTITLFTTPAATLATSTWLTLPDAATLRWPLTLAYVSVLLVIAIYGLHRYWLVYLFYKHANKRHRPARYFKQLPRVTVQLPLFNEANVSQRIIAAACDLNYPRELLQIQVLDDSTDHSQHIARAAVEQFKAKGMDIQYIHRTNRQGYKAGALAAAMDQVTGQYIAIFDADFIPPANFLRRTVHYFTDDQIGMVQTRWSHINRDDSMLTRCQAIFLDGHFVIEHAARNRSDCWINFNGTAGIWRKETILDAGSWQADTLTEDVDLSYRAQQRGWRFVYAPWITCPSELPPQINAFKTQQHRWTKGTIQTAKKLLPRISKADLPWSVKKEAFFHLTSPIVYPCVCLMVLLFYPAFFVNMQPFEDGTAGGFLWGGMLFALGTMSAGVFYIASQRAQKRDLRSTLLYLPLLMAVGIGIAVNNARACFEAIIGHESPFVRTPKYNCHHIDSANRDEQRQGASEDTTELASAATTSSKPHASPRRSMWPSWLKIRAHRIMPAFEILMGLYVVECIRLALIYDKTQMSLPFLVIFAAGYFFVGFASLWQQINSAWQARQVRDREVATPAATPSTASQDVIAEPAA